MKLRLILAALVLLVLAGWYGYEYFLGGTPVETARVRQGPIQELVEEQGRTRLPRTYLVTMPYDGRILPIDLEEGSVVKKGQLIARIVAADLDTRVAEATAAVERLEASLRENADTHVEESVFSQALKYLQSMDRTVEAAQQQVKAAEAKLGFANTSLNRERRLQTRSATSDETLERSQVNQVEADTQYRQDVLVMRALEALRAATALGPTVVRQYIDRKGLRSAVLAKELDQARARLDQAVRDRDRGTMTSSIDGVVLQRHVTDERYLPAGTVLLEIGRPEDLEVETDVLTQDVRRIAPGNAVAVFGRSTEEPDACGSVRLIHPAGFTKLSSLGVEQQRVRVVISLNAEDRSRLREGRPLGVGYRVRVRICTAEKGQALVVPRAALVRDTRSGWQVFVVRGGRAHSQAVRIGLMNDDAAEVTQGLDDGETVVVAPESNLRDGIRVRPSAAEPRP